MKIKLLITLLLGVFVFYTSSAESMIIINEIFADPPSGISGDSNNDGIRNGSQDEFIEILNYGTEHIDISGWELYDSSNIRHIFSTNTILPPYEYLVVFGGGKPILPKINWQIASTGSLVLNNGGDTIRLLDIKKQLIDQLTYKSEGGKNQSLVRSPEGIGDFVLYKTTPESNGLSFSAGTGSIREKFNPITTPEPLSLLSFFLGFSSLIFKRNKY